MSNRLHSETSPYLLQHKNNPVHWQPWDDQALEEARSLHKPILLSIGYSACHWCHVMAHESFEDPAIAKVMNALFVNIKVDREERPDLDKLYQTAQQLLTQNTGGWPLTMFLDPDTHIPFYGGTYFPKTNRYGLPGFGDLLRRVSQAFTEQADELQTQGKQIQEILGKINEPSHDKADLPSTEDLQAQARQQLGKQYDNENGGFGKAPKFPMPATLIWLLQYSAPGLGNIFDRQGLDMVMITLTGMARGGIFDHLGGGFCRYSTDAQWMIPHFEKMLYDNGQLISLYSDALAFGPDALFEDAIRDTVGWLMREMRHESGAFFSALDADSEGEEGKYYVWRRDQVKKLLDEDEYLVLETLYGLDKPANFEGRWNLHRFDAWRSVISRLSMDPEQANALLASGRAKLFAARSGRLRPGLDDKILAGWNGLIIKGLAQASVRLDEPSWLDAAESCALFIRDHMWRDGILHGSWKEAPRHGPYLDDYGFLLDGLMHLLEARFRDDLYEFAIALANGLLKDFEDSENGGFFFTSHDHEPLIQRLKPTMDDATPSGNSTAVMALFRLGHLTGEPRYLDAATAATQWSLPSVAQYPAGHCAFLRALAIQSQSYTQIILRGDDEQLASFEEVLGTGYQPFRAVYRISWNNRQLPDYLRGMVDSSKAVAYVCQGLQCSLPITDASALAATLA